MNETKTDASAQNGLPVRSTGLLIVENCGLHRRTPYVMTNVSMTQFSIARHYGGIKYNGDSYTYLPNTDELIRNDVLKWQQRQNKKRKACGGTGIVYAQQQGEP